MPRRPLRTVSYSYIYFGALLMALHVAFTVYINSTFLSQYFAEETIALLYTLGSVGTLIGLTIISTLIKRLGLFSTMALGLVTEIGALLGLFLSADPRQIAVFFMLHHLLPSLLFFFLDIYLENAIKTEHVTGRIRSNYLTIMAIAFLFSPFIVGRIVDMSSFKFVYLISGIFMTLMFFLFIDEFRKRKIHAFREIDFFDSIKKFHYHYGLVKVYGLNFLLHAFYALMIIYIPIHLTTNFGFEWTELGLMFTIMLLPFVLFEAPLGRFFDKYHGEVDVIMVGFLFMALATAGIYITTSGSFLVWTGLLFLSRMGASFVEIGTEYSFFKRVTDRDAGFISVFRTALPLSYIVAPMFAGIIISAFSLQHIFIVLSLAMICGIGFAYTLQQRKLPHGLRAHESW